MARGVGHENSVEHLRQVYGELEIVHGVVMGNRSLETGFHNYPRDLFHYCVGLDSLVLRRGSHIPEDLPDQVEEHLKRENCCGVKLYPGYNRIWLSDPAVSYTHLPPACGDRAQGHGEGPVLHLPPGLRREGLRPPGRAGSQGSGAAGRGPRRTVPAG